jgi:hypothetical protein
MNTPELSGTETQSPALAPLASETFVDEFIRDMRRENPKQFRGADRWKLHTQQATECKCVRPIKTNFDNFSA